MEMNPYFDQFNTVLAACLRDQDNTAALDTAFRFIIDAKENSKKVILIGNGGSSAIAEHMAIDLLKNAKVRAMAFSGTPLLTTLSNDRGYENVFAEAIFSYADSGDVLVAISSSGKSINILKGVEAAKKKGCRVITFSGFDAENPLRRAGDANIYISSKAYGYVEIIHNLLVHYLNDKVIGSAFYSS